MVGGQAALGPAIRRLAGAGIRVSLFIDPDTAQVEAAATVGAAAVELHTGAWADATGATRAAELKRLQTAAGAVAARGLECHAGHGLTFDTVSPVAAIPEVVELNIGHFLVSEAVFSGLEAAVAKMKRLMTEARVPGRLAGQGGQ